jgi:hypothetical protein
MTPSLPEEAQTAAEAAAAADAALLAALQERDEEPVEPTEPTIADRFVGMARLVAEISGRLKKERTPLSEATLAKLMETALQYHAWDYQRRAQEAQRSPFEQFMTPDMPENGDAGEPNEGPIVPDEYLGESNVVPVDFTPAEE